MKSYIYFCVIAAVLFAVLFVVLFAAGCAENDSATSANNSANVKSNGNFKPEPPRNATTPFEKALFSVRVGDFEQVLVFRRRDGGVFNEEDKQFLRNNRPNEQGREVNRWAECEDKKCWVAGTNFKFSRANLIALQNRFDVKDFSAGDGVETVLPEETPIPKNENTKK